MFVATPASQNAQNLDGISHSNFLGAFEVCLEFSSDSKHQFSFVADEFCELVHTNEIAMFVILFLTRSARPDSQKHGEFRHNFLWVLLKRVTSNAVTRKRVTKKIFLG